MKTYKELTPPQQEMLNRIETEKTISWFRTKPHETRLLNTLKFFELIAWDNARKEWNSL